MTARIQTQIAHATVYRNGALVVRRGTLPAPDGAETTVILAGLPLLFRSDSLRVRVSGGLSAGPIEEHPELGLKAAVDAAAEAQREALAAEERRLDAEAKRHKRLLEGAYRALTVPGLPKDPAARPGSLPDLDTWQALDDLAAARQAAAEDALAAIAARKKEIASERAALSQEAEHTPGRVTRSLQTTLRGEADGLVEVEVEYFVPGVRWAPVYQIHIDTQTRSARLHIEARVAQATGEDWVGVPLSLSTADLSRDADLPRLDSWRIGRHTPPSNDWRPLPDDLQSLFADFDGSPPPPSAPPPRKPIQRTPPKPTPPPPPPPRSQPAAAALSADIPVPSARPAMQSQMSSGAVPSMAMPSAPPPPGGAARKRSSARRSRMQDDRSMAREESYGGAGGGGGRPEPMEPPGADAPKATLLDYAWLRLADPRDKRRRGKLLPITLESAYADLLDERGGDEAMLDAFKAAIRDLERQQSKLMGASLPPGCFDVRQASFYHRYPAGPRVDLPSDGVFRQVQVARVSGDCALSLRAVPRQDARAYRFAELKNPFGRPLLAGPMQVYLDGAFVVNSTLKTTGSGGALLMNLGVEDRVRIARNATFSQSEHGMFSATSRLEHAVETEIRSNLPAPVTLLVQERLPLDAGNDGIEVELGEASPAPRREAGPRGENIPGGLTWSLTLAPGRMHQIKYRYTIDISARKELVGGNRREP